MACGGCLCKRNHLCQVLGGPIVQKRRGGFCWLKLLCKVYFHHPVTCCSWFAPVDVIMVMNCSCCPIPVLGVQGLLPVRQPLLCQGRDTNSRKQKAVRPNVILWGKNEIIGEKWRKKRHGIWKQKMKVLGSLLFNKRLPKTQHNFWESILGDFSPLCGVGNVSKTNHEEYADVLEMGRAHSSVEI